MKWLFCIAVSRKMTNDQARFNLVHGPLHSSADSILPKSPRDFQRNAEPRTPESGAEDLTFAAKWNDGFEFVARRSGGPRGLPLAAAGGALGCRAGSGQTDRRGELVGRLRTRSGWRAESGREELISSNGRQKSAKNPIAGEQAKLNVFCCFRFAMIFCFL